MGLQATEVPLGHSFYCAMPLFYGDETTHAGEKLSRSSDSGIYFGGFSISVATKREKSV